MRRKVFSLLVLLLTVCSSALGTKTIDGNTTTWNFDSWSENSNTGADVQGLVFSGIRNESGKNDWHIVVTPETGGFINMIPNASVKVPVTLGQTVVFTGHSSNMNNNAKHASFTIENLDANNSVIDAISNINVNSYTNVDYSYAVKSSGYLVLKSTGGNGEHYRLTQIKVSGATAEISGNPLDVITFTGDGDLGTNVFNMANWTLEVGGDMSTGEKPQVTTLDGIHYAFVKDHYEAHATHAFTNNTFPNGNHYPSAGTFFVIKPTADGTLSLVVRGTNYSWHANDHTNGYQPLLLYDIDGNQKSSIPFSQYSSTSGSTIAYSNLQAGKIYYLFANPFSTVYLHQATFYKSNKNILQLMDYDSGEALGDSTWVANTTTRAVISDQYNNNEFWNTHGKYALINYDNSSNLSPQLPRSTIFPFSGLGSQKVYTIMADFVLNGSSSGSTQFAIYRKTPSNTVTVWSDEENKYVEVQKGDIAATDYLLSIDHQSGNSWTISAPGHSETITIPYSSNQYAWCRLNLSVDHRAHKLYFKIEKITNADGTGSTVINHNNENGEHQYWDISSGDNGTAHGLSFYSNGSGAIGKFDNILVSSTEIECSVTTPQIALGQVVQENGQYYREVFITAGVSDVYIDESHKVSTWWSWIGNNWSDGEDFTDNAGWSWGRYFNNETEGLYSYSPDVKKLLVPVVFLPRTLTVRSVIVNYPVGGEHVESDIVEMVIPASMTVTGGYQVVDMSKGNGEEYYNPTVRFYVDSRYLTQTQKESLRISLTYWPLDYGTVNSTETEIVDGKVVAKPITAFADQSMSEGNGTKYYEYVIPRSATYQFTVTGNGIQEFVSAKKNYYYKKYKITYQTPDLATLDPNDPIAAINNNYDRSTYGTWDDWSKQDGSWIEGWGWQPYTFVWTNGGSTEKTSTINWVEAARSRASSQTYNLRTVQRSTNQLRFVAGAGLVKDINEPWEYRCQLAHIGMGNEIPMYQYTTADINGSGHQTSAPIYPTPFINEHNVPECSFTIPARAALKKYLVYTPVEVKHMSNKGLATFSSYYALYSVDDIYMENDEKINTYRSQTTTYKYGGDYKLIQTWYCENHEGLLLAANEYEGSELWKKTRDFEKTGYPWGGTSYDVELRIIDVVTAGCWKENNEMKTVLFDGENGNHNPYKLYASSTYDPNNTSEDNGLEGHPRLILTKGTYENDDCYNFFTMPEISNWANMGNKSSYIEPRETKYKDFNGYPKSQEQAQGIKVYIGDCEFEDEAVGIEDVLVNSAEVTRMNDDAFYTISGQKVSHPTSGLYIHNGKKVLVK